MIDTSESMNSGEPDEQYENWISIKEFIKKYITKLNVEESSSRVSLLKVSKGYRS